MRCGALLEHTGLYERLSAADNLEFYGRVWRMTSNERRGRSRELLTRFGLWERRGETVGSWSRGMKQKLAIARALLNRPEVLFLDEPTSGLDPVAAAALHEDLLGLAGGDGVTIFLTTHNLAEAEKLCDEVAVIRQGRLAAVGAPAELRARSGAPRVEISGHGFTGIMIDQLRARPEVARVELSEGGLKIELRQAGDAAPLVALLAASGAQIEEVRKGAPSLEEAFLDLVEEKS
jgi:ABC-2 type transport system ATP-binding protein